jgi:hypothetical protein
MTTLARFSALALVIVPATVTGEVMPPMDIDMEQIGIPAFANSTCASMAPSSKESGAIGQLITDISGRFRKASLPPATSAASSTWTLASSALWTVTP